jgi:anti-sigma B factor antagonist
MPKGANAVSPLWVWSDAHGQASFRVETRHVCAVVVATGEIDLATAEALREALASAAQASDRIIVDLAAVTFIDMHGFSALLSSRQRHPPHAAVSLVRPAPMVRKIIRMARLDEVFPIYDALAEALDPSHDPPNG